MEAAFVKNARQTLTLNPLLSSYSMLDYMCMYTQQYMLSRYHLLGGIQVQWSSNNTINAYQYKFADPSTPTRLLFEDNLQSLIC